MFKEPRKWSDFLRDNIFRHEKEKKMDVRERGYEREK
jgi:hypothetical protein